MADTLQTTITEVCRCRASYSITSDRPMAKVSVADWRRTHPCSERQIETDPAAVR